MNVKKFDVSVIGLGYIGIPLVSAILSRSTTSLVGVDNDQLKLSMLSNKMLPIEEPGLSEILFEEQNFKNLTLSANVVPAHIHIVAVPTPFNLTKNHWKSFFVVTNPWKSKTFCDQNTFRTAYIIELTR